MYDDLSSIYDQEYLFYRYRLWRRPSRRLPYIYNWLVSNSADDPLFDLGAIKVAHFIWKYKPWSMCVMVANESVAVRPIIRQYFEYFDKTIKELKEKYPKLVLHETAAVIADEKDF